MSIEANLQSQLLGAGRSHLPLTRAATPAAGPRHVTASGEAMPAPPAPAPERLALRRAMRAVVALALRCLLRLRVRGAGALPARGPALVVCNHVSYLDALVLAAACPYPLRFVYWHKLARVPLLGGLLRLVGGIAVAAEAEDPGLYRGALEAIDAALAAGEVVAIFPEGRLTKDGEVGPFRRGVERVLSRRPVPVVPAALRGLYGGLFSRAPKKRLPGPRPRVEVVVAPALAPGGLCASSLRARVCALRGDVR
ncbi:MAG TPA: lysophospholipid acyltransferase family protein [Polyangiaceae bacterium]|nr:lysophospholipid acyltransferase family protein [Polyangiaceae bacterium]